MFSKFNFSEASAQEEGNVDATPMPVHQEFQVDFGNALEINDEQGNPQVIDLTGCILLFIFISFKHIMIMMKGMIECQFCVKGGDVEEPGLVTDDSEENVKCDVIMNSETVEQSDNNNNSQSM